MTYKQYFEEKISDINVRMAAERNFIEQRREENFNRDLPFLSSQGKHFSGAFSWYKTPEGIEFWSWFNSTLK